MGTSERGHEFNLILGGDAMTNIFVVLARLRESHLDVLHKGATYEGSGMPDTRRDLFSLSTTSGPLAATVRENINSIHTSYGWLRMLRPRFHVPVSTCPTIRIVVTPRHSVIRFIRFRSLRNIERFLHNTGASLHGKKEGKRDKFVLWMCALPLHDYW